MSLPRPPLPRFLKIPTRIAPEEIHVHPSQLEIVRERARRRGRIIVIRPNPRLEPGIALWFRFDSTSPAPSDTPRGG